MPAAATGKLNMLERIIRGVKRRALSSVHCLTQSPILGAFAQALANRGGAQARRLTSGPEEHWFGYYDICPWSGNGERLLAMAHPCLGGFRPEQYGAAAIGLVDPESGGFTRLAETRAWNWQQGALAQWHPAAPDRKIIYNDCDDGRLFACVLDVETGEKSELPAPISAVSPDGRYALSLNFARVGRLRGKYEYGYFAASADASAGELHPKDDGVCRIDLETGGLELVVSMADILAAHPGKDAEAEREMWVNHTVFDASGSRFCFFARSRQAGAERDPLEWFGHIFSASTDGGDLRCLVPFHPTHKEPSHFSWVKAGALCVYHRGFYGIVKDVDGAQTDIFLTGVTNGHPAICPANREVFVSDTYPLGFFRHQTLWLYHMASKKRAVLGKFFAARRYQDDYRCDLHPRWNRDGTHVCFDAVCDGPGRQLYVIDARPALAAIQ